jgi:ABC-type Fe3+/spermidine/putrescine transport system ATPase subunit
VNKTGAEMAEIDETAEIDVELSSISKTYGAVRAVDGFSLPVPKGSFTTLLGPSGCGKTTLLRIIAGFFEPDSGQVRIGGKDQRGIPPEKRNTGMVFQDYALFPHMSARENLAYGLRIRKLDGTAREREIAHTAEILGLEDLLDRYPGELSGGQQQRLALGRAVILKPRLLLMDEPLSNLDAKLRLRVRTELKDIQRRLGITTVYVTHDQEEALSLSDYIAVMNRGRLEQAGTPEEVYYTPASAFAADFSGPANFVVYREKHYLVRPEWFSVYPAGIALPAGAEFTLTGRVAGADFLGRVTRLRVDIEPSDIEPSPAGGDRALTVDAAPSENLPERFRPGTIVQLAANRAWELGVY